MVFTAAHVPLEAGWSRAALDSDSEIIDTNKYFIRSHFLSGYLTGLQSVYTHSTRTYCFIGEIMKWTIRYMNLNSPDTDNKDDIHVARPGLVPATEAAGDTCH